MLVGASIMGLFSTFVIEYLHKKARLQSDASIGVTFTAFFAVGIILISLFAKQVDLDQDCVLYGEIAYVPLDVWITDAKVNMGPRIIWSMGIVSLLVIAFVYFFYKELKINTFDPAFATAIGLSAAVWHYALMGMVTVVTITSFEAVGAILVIAFLAGPPATAFLLTTRLKSMLFLAVGFSLSATVFGYLLAFAIQGSVAGAISTVIGLQFVVVFVIHLVKKRQAGKVSLEPQNTMFAPVRVGNVANPS